MWPIDDWTYGPWTTEPLWRYGVKSREDLIEEPTEEPISVQFAIDHLRALNLNEEGRIRSLIKVARQAGEYYTRRAFMPQSWQLIMDRFPKRYHNLGIGAVGGHGQIRLARPPVVSVVSIEYIDVDDVVQTLDPALYQFDLPRGPYAGYGRIKPAPDQTWPDTKRQRYDAVRVTTTNGYVDTASPANAQIPEQILQGMLVMIGEMYKQRSETMPNASPAVVTARRLWAPYRVY